MFSVCCILAFYFYTSTTWIGDGGIMFLGLSVILSVCHIVSTAAILTVNLHQPNMFEYSFFILQFFSVAFNIIEVTGRGIHRHCQTAFCGVITCTHAASRCYYLRTCCKQVLLPACMHARFAIVCVSVRTKSRKLLIRN